MDELQAHDFQCEHQSVADDEDVVYSGYEDEAPVSAGHGAEVGGGGVVVFLVVEEGEDEEDGDEDEGEPDGEWDQDRVDEAGCWEG